jgi:hypothetical protein
MKIVLHSHQAAAATPVPHLTPYKHVHVSHDMTPKRNTEGMNALGYILMETGSGTQAAVHATWVAALLLGTLRATKQSNGV